MSLKQCFKGSLDVPLIPYGRRVHKTIGATAGNITTNLSPGVGKRWKVLNGRISLVTDGTAVDRGIHITLTDGTNTTTRFPVSPAIPASTSANLSLLHNYAVGGGATSIEYHIAVGDIWVEGTDQFRVRIADGVAGDSYSGRFVVMEYDV